MVINVVKGKTISNHGSNNMHLQLMTYAFDFYGLLCMYLPATAYDCSGFVRRACYSIGVNACMLHLLFSVWRPWRDIIARC
jgi:hypothetical protein